MKGCSKPLFCLQKKSVYVILNLHICMQIQENYRGIIMGTASNEEIIYGKNAVTEALKAEKPIDTVFVLKGAQGMNQIIALAKKQGIVVKDAGEDKLKALCGDKHGGVAAALSSVSYCTVEDILANAESKGKPPFIIICDEIQDPHNLGAILRTAECAGAHGVIIPKRRSVGLNATVGKTSAGAIEYMPVAKVTNLVKTMEQLKKEGLWFACADMGENDHFDTNLKGPIGLVIGSEGEGVSRLVKENCDFTASIPMYGKISSLNASVAAALLMYEVVRQRNYSK